MSRRDMISVESKIIMLVSAVRYDIIRNVQLKPVAIEPAQRLVERILQPPAFIGSAEKASREK
jgi:hypothetical protein